MQCFVFLFKNNLFNLNSLLYDVQQETYSYDPTHEDEFFRRACDLKELEIGGQGSLHMFRS